MTSPLPLPKLAPLTFGGFVAAQRASLRLSLRGLAGRAALDAGYLSKVERGVMSPPQQPDVLSRLARALQLGATASVRLRDLAAFSDGRLPADLASDARVLRVLPALSDALRRLAADNPGMAATATDHGQDSLLGQLVSILRTQGTARSSDAPRAAEAHAVPLPIPQPVPQPSPQELPADRRSSTARRRAAAASRRPPEGTSDAASRAPQDAVRLQRAFDRLAASQPAFRRLIAAISTAGARAVVFGGWPRDHIASAVLGRPIQPADVDLVVEGLTPAALERVLVRLDVGDVTRNAFGGFVLSTEGVKVDVWTLGTTYTFVVRRERPRVDALPFTTVFTVESVIFKPRQWWGEPSIVDGGLYDSLARGEIDLQQGEKPFPAFQVGRALQYAAKLRLRLSPAVLAFLQETLHSAEGASEAREGVQRFGHPAFRRQVLGDLRKVRVALTRDAAVGSGGAR